MVLKLKRENTLYASMHGEQYCFYPTIMLFLTHV